MKFRANEVNDKYGDHWYREHVIAFLMCLIGAAQFDQRVDLWARDVKGLYLLPDFGQWITEDRFKRVGATWREVLSPIMTMILGQR